MKKLINPFVVKLKYSDIDIKKGIFQSIKLINESLFDSTIFNKYIESENTNIHLINRSIDNDNVVTSFYFDLFVLEVSTKKELNYLIENNVFFGKLLNNCAKIYENYECSKLIFIPKRLTFLEDCVLFSVYYDNSNYIVIISYERDSKLYNVYIHNYERGIMYVHSNLNYEFNLDILINITPDF